MRHYLLPEGGNFYKANLHTHSIYSDGARTVEEIKRDYMAHGRWASRRIPCRPIT